MPHHCNKYDRKRFSVKHFYGKCIKSKKIEADKAKTKNIETENIVVDGTRINSFQSQTLISKRHDISTAVNFSFKTQSAVCPVLNIPYTLDAYVEYPATITEGNIVKGLREAVFDLLVKPINQIKAANTTVYFTYIFYRVSNQSGTTFFMYNVKTNEFEPYDQSTSPITEDYFFSIGVTRLLLNAWQDLHLGVFLSQSETEKIVEIQQSVQSQIYIGLSAKSDVGDVGTNFEFCEGSKVQLIY